MEKLPKPDQQGTARAMARVVARMVQLFPTRGRSKEHTTTGGVDQKADSMCILVEVAQRERASEETQEVRMHSQTMRNRIQFKGRLAYRQNAQPANGLVERCSTKIWLLYAIRGFWLSQCVQSPDAENRTSGGVGALPGEIPAGDPIENEATQ